ncbi:MAG: carboxypeptidase regulatory-like domain-containing protein [Gemmatimonadales bacterium]
MMIVRRLSRPFCLCALLLPSTLPSQGTGGAVRGNVTEHDGVPIALAQVRLMGGNRPQNAQTDSAGIFQIPRVAVGWYIVRVTMTGYSPAMLPIEVHRDETVELRVSLVAAAVALAPVEVTADAVPFVQALRGFQERRARAQGHFFNHEEIARMQVGRFTDVLRRVPGVQLVPVRGPFEMGEAVRMSRTIGVTGARACPVLYYINGSPFPVTGDIPIDHYIDPDDIAALEIYQGMSQIPAQFNSSSHNARCGVIVIWTLSGDSTERH